MSLVTMMKYFIVIYWERIKGNYILRLIFVSVDVTSVMTMVKYLMIFSDRLSKNKEKLFLKFTMMQ